MRKPVVLILLFVFFFSTFLGAQNPAYEVIDFTKGLPSNSVYNIYQDSRGYIWIGHDKGLTRYNGSTFQNYSTNIRQSRALSNIHEDSTGRIWCQNFNGDIYFTNQDSLGLLTAMPSAGNIIPIWMRNRQEIFTLRNGQIVCYDIFQKKKKVIRVPGNRNFVHGNMLVQKGIVAALSSAHELVVLENNKFKIAFPIPKEVNPYLYVLAGKKIITIPRTGNEIAAVFENGKLLHTVKLQINAIIQNAILIDGEVWISTTQGIYCLDQNLKPVPGKWGLLKEFNVSTIIKDHENSFWISTLNRGLIYIPNLEMYLSPFAPGFTAAGYFLSTNKLILGTGDNRIFEYTPSTNQFLQLHDFKINHDIFQIYNDVANDLIWVASDKLYTIYGSNISSNISRPMPMKDIEYMGNGCYAVATSYGFYILTSGKSSDAGYLKNIFGNTLDSIGSDMYFINGYEGRSKCIAFDQLNTTLYGSNFKGTFYWSKKGSGILTHKGGPIYATDILVKGSKTYISTYRGVVFVATNKEITGRIGPFRGLQNQAITKMASGGDFLWILYENALVRYNVFKNTYRIFTTAHGLIGSELKDIALADNQIFLATRMGLVHFSQNLNNTGSNPRIIIEDVKVNTSVRSPEDGVYYLKSFENNLEVNYSVITYKGRAGAVVYYKLNNRNWVRLGPPSRSLNLLGLGPGDYELTIRAVTEDGKVIEMQKPLLFTIAYPIWGRWWFIILILAMVSTVVYLFVSFRLSKLRKEAELMTAKERLEKELQISTLTAIRSQMNPHFIFNALNTVQSYIYTNDSKNASDYLSKFSELTRMILDMSNKEKIALADELRALRLYLQLEEKRFDGNFHYNIIIQNDVNIDEIKIPSMIIQPYVENAVKHGLLHKKGERRLRIEFVVEGKALIVFVDDNGIGRQKSEEMKKNKQRSHTSFSTLANKRRLELLNQGRVNTIAIEYLDKVDSYNNSLGTMVILSIPFNF